MKRFSGGWEEVFIVKVVWQKRLKLCLVEPLCGYMIFD